MDVLPGLPFDNSYARLPERFYARLAPTPVAAPRLVKLNQALAQQLGLDPGALASRDKCLFALAQMVMEASAPMDLQWDTSDIEDVFPMERMKFLSLPSR